MSRLSGPDVIAAWGLANGVLVAGLIGYGEGAIPVSLYGGSAVLIELVALATAWVTRRHPVWAARSPSPRTSRRSALVAAAVAIAGIGIVWSWWMALPALYPLAALLTPEGSP